MKNVPYYSGFTLHFPTSFSSCNPLITLHSLPVRTFTFHIKGIVHIHYIHIPLRSHIIFPKHYFHILLNKTPCPENTIHSIQFYILSRKKLVIIQHEYLQNVINFIFADKFRSIYQLNIYFAPYIIQSRCRILIKNILSFSSIYSYSGVYPSCF